MQGGLDRMYVPVPPAPPPQGATTPGIDSSALARALPRMGWLSSTSGRSTTSLAVRSSTLNVLEWHPVTVTGRLRARTAIGGLAGRMVTLQILGHGGWSSAAVARTGRSGDFRLRFVPRRI